MDAVYIFGQESDISRSISYQNLRFFTGIVWHGCINSRELLLLFRYVEHLQYVELGHTCLQNETWVDTYRDVMDSKVSPISLAYLSHLSIEGFSAGFDIVSTIRKYVVTGKLKTLRIRNTAITITDTDHLLELLVINKNIESLIFERIESDVWILNENLPVFRSLRVLSLDYVDSHLTRNTSVSHEFCSTFPTLNSLYLTSGIPIYEIYKIMQCKTIKYLSLTLFVPTLVKSVNLNFLEMSNTLESFFVYFEFEDAGFGMCEVTGVQRAHKLYEFSIIVQSNCRNVS